MAGVDDCLSPFAISPFVTRAILAPPFYNTLTTFAWTVTVLREPTG